MSDMLKELMKQKAAAKKDPEFYAAQEELAHKLTWATMMRGAGRLSKSEFNEFESHLAAEYLDAMPTETFIAMQEDGSYSDLETIARSHDGTRDSYDVRKDRVALDKKVTKDALHEGLASGKLESKRYAQEFRKLIGNFEDEMSRRVTDADDDGDHDDVAMDIILRDLPQDEPEQEPGTAPRLPDSITSRPAPADDNRIKDASED